MRAKSSSAKKPAEQVVKDIRRATRRHFSAALRLSTPDGHEQRLQDYVRRLTALHRAADDTAEIEIDQELAQIRAELIENYANLNVLFSN